MDMQEISLKISELESGENSFSACAKLADLYAVRDHMDTAPVYERSYSQAASAADTLSLPPDSDFLKAVNGKDAIDAWAVMDDLMDTLRVVNPRVYDSVLRKIRQL